MTKRVGDNKTASKTTTKTTRIEKPKQNGVAKENNVSSDNGPILNQELWFFILTDIIESSRMVRSITHSFAAMGRFLLYRLYLSTNKLCQCNSYISLIFDEDDFNFKFVYIELC